MLLWRSASAERRHRSGCANNLTGAGTRESARSNEVNSEFESLDCDRASLPMPLAKLRHDFFETTAAGTKTSPSMMRRWVRRTVAVAAR